MVKLIEMLVLKHTLRTALLKAKYLGYDPRLGKELLLVAC